MEININIEVKNDTERIYTDRQKAIIDGKTKVFFN